MFKNFNLTSDANLTNSATWGLTIFVVVFVCVTLWALTRPRKTIQRWASLPLQDGTDPVEPRDDKPNP